MSTPRSTSTTTVSAEDVINAICFALAPTTAAANQLVPCQSSNQSNQSSRPVSHQLGTFAFRNVTLSRNFVILDDNDIATRKVPVGNKRKLKKAQGKEKELTFSKNATSVQMNRQIRRSFSNILQPGQNFK